MFMALRLSCLIILYRAFQHLVDISVSVSTISSIFNIFDKREVIGILTAITGRYLVTVCGYSRSTHRRITVR